MTHSSRGLDASRSGDHGDPPVSELSRFSVAGKTVVVTGGTSGIREMLAETFARAGAPVGIVSRSPDACERVASRLSRLGRYCVGVPADLASATGPTDMATGVRDALGGVDVLVNNAGVTWGATLERYPDAAFDRVFSLNVRAAFRGTVELLPELRAAASADDPARVINVSSIEGTRVPQWENYAYPASKAAVNMLTPATRRTPCPRPHHRQCPRAGPVPESDDRFRERGSVCLG